MNSIIKYGFYASIAKDKCVNNEYAINKAWRYLSYANFTIAYNPLPKFEKDKLFFEDEKKIVLLDGVIFNINELISTGDNWQDYASKRIDSNPEAFINDLRGSFCGVFYFKETCKAIVFTNQSGEKSIYYQQSGEDFYISSHVQLFKDVFECQLDIDDQSAYEMLLTGSVLDNRSMFKNIFRIAAGTLLEITDGSYVEKKISCISKCS